MNSSKCCMLGKNRQTSYLPEEINREEYDNWRYHYPEFDTTQRWAKVPSQELSDALVEAFKDHLKDK